MSDGPYRSLPMRQGWRDLAERGDRAAFDCEQIADAVPGALRDDWSEERCDKLAEDLRRILGDSQQGSLFGRTKDDLLDAIKKLSGAGFQMQRLLIDAVTQAVDDGFSGSDAMVEGTANALAIRCAAGVRQVEEHYLRSRAAHRAAYMRGRLEDGAQRHSDFRAMARGVLKMDNGSNAPPKNDGLDDGVRL